ncbi:MAG: ribonuclease HII [Desulfovibrio sp.]|nr:ribonuclease HII [Desulfovibrio sp.]
MADALLVRLPGQSKGLCAGIDEVGRGCLAGPVVAAAVILPEAFALQGLTDSKKLTAKKREELCGQIKTGCLAWAIGLVGQRAIDRINILQATLTAMSMAVAKLSLAPIGLWIDGNKTLPEQMLIRFWRKHHTEQLPWQRAIVKGDASVPAISAASILAKTYRDAMMHAFAKRWPEYGFERHVGYGSALHLRMLRAHGPCPLHRRTFRGVLPQKPDDYEMSLLRSL